MSSSDDPVIEMDDIQVHFSKRELMGLGKSTTVQAVDGVSLSIAENDVVAIVGESGCGKTTLGKTAVGLQRPTDGRLKYRGQDFWETKDREDSLWGSLRRREEGQIPYREMRRSLQIIHQDPGESLNSNYTILAQLEAPLERWQPDLSGHDRRERIHGFLEYVGMSPPSDYANRYPHQLSGGEQQRIALIRALLMNPDLILADEAVSALDVSLRVEIMDLMLDLQERFSTSFLFISHNLANARYLAKKSGGRIGIMYLGEIVEIGPVDEVIHNPQHPYTKVLLWSTADLFEKQTVEEPPVRSVDIPDPEDPPSGCRFHTRCPEARTACVEEAPALLDTGSGHRTACFREVEDHEYWESEVLADQEAAAPTPDGSTNTRNSSS